MTYTTTSTVPLRLPTSIPRVLKSQTVSHANLPSSFSTLADSNARLARGCFERRVEGSHRAIEQIDEQATSHPSSHASKSMLHLMQPLPSCRRKRMEMQIGTDGCLGMLKIGFYLKKHSKVSKHSSKNHMQGACVRDACPECGFLASAILSLSRRLHGLHRSFAFVLRHMKVNSLGALGH